MAVTASTGDSGFGVQFPASSPHVTAVGGTSVAAPLIGGVYGANGGKVKFASKAYKKSNKLFDVVSGSNGTCSPSYFCNAGPGYDGPTGLGTPNGIKAF